MTAAIREWAEHDIDTALVAANPNVLRIVLLQFGSDPELEKMTVEKLPIRGGAFYASVLGVDDGERVRRKAHELLQQGPLAPPTDLTPERVRALMELLTAEPLSDVQFAMGWEELALEDMPRGVEWSKEPVPLSAEDFRVVVIGAGISGIAAAIQLGRLGIPYTVIERQKGVGGTWQLNTYPEARVDTSSFFYQFRFEKNYPWSQYFAAQPETLKFLEYVVDKYDIASKMRFESEVREARWSDEDRKWHLTIQRADGEIEHETANVIVSASGLLSTPKMPDIAGIGDFAGPMWHSTNWNHDQDLEGKRIALIGTGSTGTQMMPYLAEQASELTVYQRTANWIAPVDNYHGKVSDAARWLFDNIPNYWNWYCYSQFIASCGLQGGEEYDREWQRAGGQISRTNDNLRESIRSYIHGKVGHDPELFAKCIPTHPPLSRRPVVDNGFYDALCRDNVELVTDHIERFTHDGIRTDGKTRQHDVVIVAAGFDVHRYFWPVTYRGRDGTTLEQLWERDGARAYLGIALPGFPNMWSFYGPNASPRAGGFYTWAELWSRYIAKAIVHMIEANIEVMEVKREVFDDYNTRLDTAMTSLIWYQDAEGSYYVNDRGRTDVKMPWLVHDYYSQIVTPNPADYSTQDRERR